MRFPPSALKPAGASRPPRAEPSVGWFAPLQLLRTAQQVAIATVFGQNADARVIEALAQAAPAAGPEVEEPDSGLPHAMHALVHDYRDRALPFRLDYTADLGDGWDGTYSVAYHLAQDSLPLRRGDDGRGGPAVLTGRGSVLVFGGDEVYPTPSFEAYERRLVLPYSHALPPGAAPPGEEEPHVFAIPGNHDWYDSLVSFTRLFCSRQSIAGWRAPQARSYFALRLPQDWWLLGTDIQLGSEIDGPQRRFFEALAAGMAPQDRIILCHSEPHWLYQTIYPEAYRYRTVRALEEAFGARIRVFLSGDCHFYTRHEGPGGVQKIIAGGGGAFAHVTCGLGDERLTGSGGGSRAPLGSARPTREATGCEKRAAFPSWADSLRLCLANPLLFHWRNPTFGLATAFLYAVTGAALIRPGTGARTAADVTGEAVTRLFTDPFSLFWTVSVVLGVIFFTETHSRWYRWSAGLVHAGVHLVAATALAGHAAALSQGWLGAGSLSQAPAAAALTALGGYAVGPLVLALYLTLSLLVFGRHRTHLSSALRSPDYRNFLRLKIDPGGKLTIYPVGIRRAARRWATPEAAGVSTRSLLVPVDGTAPFLIEDPIEVGSHDFFPGAAQRNPGPRSAATHHQSAHGS